ncbi:diguanylate cyclase [bacterium]|nr:diguanylate cyclase [bacterium]
MKSLSLRTKLILTLTSLLFVAFLATNLINYQVSRNSMHSILVNESLPIISDNIYSQIQQDLMRPIDISSLMANDTFVKDWMLEGESDVDRIKKYLLEIQQQYNFVSVFLVSDKTYRYYHYEGIHKTISRSDAHDVWYFDFLESGKPYDLDVDTDEAADNNLTIFINHRLNDYDGNLLGVIGVGLSMNRVGKLLAEHQGDYQRDIYMTDPNGVIQVHSNLDKILQANVFENKALEAFAQSIKTSFKEVGVFEYDEEGVHIILSVRYIPEIHWYLFVEQNETATLAHIRLNLIRNLIFGFIISCVIIGITILTVNYFQRRLEVMATSDALTGSYNRRMFVEQAQAEFRRSQRYNKPLTVLMLDIDFFKKVNDTYGHMAGDKVLKAFAHGCESSLRDTDLFGRMGGEEFAAVLVETDLEQAYTVAQRVLSDIANMKIVFDDYTISITVSIGMTKLEADDPSFDALISRSDEALYKAKQNGRNRIETA